MTDFAFTGFIAGIASGATKLLIGHPFDTIKIRMQTNSSHFGTSTLSALRLTLRKEGIKGLYKGCTPPLLGWVLMDSVGLGSLENFKRQIQLYNITKGNEANLSLKQHGIAGAGAGIVVSFVASPIELLKAQMQKQHSLETTQYKTPLNCLQHINQINGVIGVYRGLGACMLFRSGFCILWSSYEWYTRQFKVLFEQYNLNLTFVPLMAGGCSANTFWTLWFPTDVIKNRIMSSPTAINYPTIRQVTRDIYNRDGIRGFYRGFVPCFLRSFPTNGAALYVFDTCLKLQKY